MPNMNPLLRWRTYNRGFCITKELLNDDIYSLGGHPVRKTKALRDKQTKAEILTEVDLLGHRVNTLMDTIANSELVIRKLRAKLAAATELRQGCATLSEALMHVLKMSDL